MAHIARSSFYFTLVLALGLLHSTSAQAQSFSSFSLPLEAGSTSTGSLAANRTYTCYVVDDDGSYALSTTIAGPNGQTIQGTRPQVEEEYIAYDYFDGREAIDGNLKNNFVSFTTPPGSDGFGVYTMSLSSVSEGARNRNPSCAETSRACSFNTFVNDFNFLEVTNEGSKAIEVSYTATDFDGNVSTDTGVVLPGKRVDFDIHSKVGASKFGSIVIHPKSNADFGQTISAKLSQYKGDTLSNTETCRRLPDYQSPSAEMM